MAPGKGGNSGVANAGIALLAAPPRLECSGAAGYPSEMEPVKIRSRGRISVPEAVRRTLGLQTGDEMVWSIEGEKVKLSKLEDEPADAPGTNRSTPTADRR